MRVLLRPKMCEITFRGSLLGPVLQGVYSQVVLWGSWDGGDGEGVRGEESIGGIVDDNARIEYG